MDPPQAPQSEGTRGEVMEEFKRILIEFDIADANITGRRIAMKLAETRVEKLPK